QSIRSTYRRKTYLQLHRFSWIEGNNGFDTFTLGYAVPFYCCRVVVEIDIVEFSVRFDSEIDFLVVCPSFREAVADDGMVIYPFEVGVCGCIPVHTKA